MENGLSVTPDAFALLKVRTLTGHRLASAQISLVTWAPSCMMKVSPAGRRPPAGRIQAPSSLIDPFSMLLLLLVSVPDSRQFSLANNVWCDRSSAVILVSSIYSTYLSTSTRAFVGNLPKVFWVQVPPIPRDPASLIISVAPHRHRGYTRDRHSFQLRYSLSRISRTIRTRRTLQKATRVL